MTKNKNILPLNDIANCNNVTGFSDIKIAQHLFISRRVWEEKYDRSH